jgi:hypothetical protein
MECNSRGGLPSMRRSKVATISATGVECTTKAITFKMASDGQDRRRVATAYERRLSRKEAAE